jgi:hypothetical protein
MLGVRLLRNLIYARRLLAIALLAMALCVKALVPSGYMVSASGKTITVGLCTDGIGAAKSMTITIPMDPSAPGNPTHKGKADSPCAFSAVSMAATGGADAPLLALALAFVLALGIFADPAPARAAAFRILPPSQGPPVSA